MRPVGRAEAMVVFFLRAPADLESVGRGGSTTITFVAKQLNHGLSLPTKRSGIVSAIHLPNAIGGSCSHRQVECRAQLLGQGEQT